VTCFVPATPTTDVGADGTEPVAAAAVVMVLLDADATLDPAAFVAITLKL
jgi:hypothetical protein